MRSIGSAAAALFAVSCAVGASGADAPVPSGAAEKFYRVVLDGREGGVPAGARLVKFRPVVSTGLFALLERAGAAEREYAHKTHNESPPLVEGDLFTSLFEGATSFRIEGCQPKTSSATCRVALISLDPAGGKPVEWTDTVVLAKEGGAWRVSDVEFGGTWQFMHAGRLVGLLESVIAQSEGP